MRTNVKDYEGTGFTETETTLEYGSLAVYGDGTQRVLSQGGWSPDKAFMKDLVERRNKDPFGDESYRLISRETAKTVTIKIEA